MEDKIYKIVALEDGPYKTTKVFDKSRRNDWISYINKLEDDDFNINIEFGYDKKTKTYWVTKTYYDYYTIDGDDGVQYGSVVLAHAIKRLEESK